jgi:hypothetical protein
MIAADESERLHSEWTPTDGAWLVEPVLDGKDPVFEDEGGDTVPVYCTPLAAAATENTEPPPYS